MSVYHWTEYLRRTLFVTLFIAVCGIVSTPLARGADESVAEEWIFNVILPPAWTIADAMIAYQYEGSYYLPAVELGEALDFYIEAEVDRGYVSGFAGDEGNTFTIDSEKGELILEGEIESLPDDAVLSQDMVFDEDVFVRIDVLNRIWPIEMELLLSNLQIIIEAEQDLAFMERLRRSEAQERIFAQRGAGKTDFSSLPFVDNPVKMLGKPAYDIQATYTYDDADNTLRGSNNITGTQQVAGFVADYSANYAFIEGKFRRPESIRLRMEKQAIGEDYIVSPYVKRLELGDVTLPRRDLIGNTTGGRGFIISDKTSERDREFDRVTVEGTGPPGWEVEVYNNDQLIEVGIVDGVGEYRFEDIVLNYGKNNIRTVLYGPQGQIREEVEEYSIGNSMMKPGEFDYSVGLTDTGRSLILLENEPRLQPRGVTKNAEFFYGLNNTFTFFGSFTETPTRDDLQQYYTIGTSFSTPIGLGSVEGYKQINGGNAVDTRFITELFGVRLNLRAAMFDRAFESDDAGYDDSGKALETEIQANTNVNLFVPLSLKTNLLHTEFFNGTVTSDLQTNVSYSGRGLRISNQTTSRFVDEIHENSNGAVAATWRQGEWQLRGNLGYRMHPEWELSTGSTELRYTKKNGFQSALSFAHDFTNSTSTVGTQIGYDFDNLVASFDTQYRQHEGWMFMLRATSSLHPYTEDEHYTMSGRSRRNTAQVLAEAFIDRNNDGIYNGDDEPMQDVRLRIDNGRSTDKTNEDGVIIATIPNNNEVAIRVDEASLIDPYLKPSNKGFRTMGRKGSMPRFSFPIVETGSIDGTVYRTSNDAPVQGMRLQLVDAEGAVAMETETAYDGYYAFEFVLPGDYIVRADPEYQVNVPNETVTVSSEEPYVFGIDMFLIEPAAEETAVEETDGESVGIAQTNLAPAADGTVQQAQTPSDGGSSSVVKAVRIGEHSDKIRLVLDLSVMADYKIEAGEEGYIVLVDMPDTTFEAAARASYPNNAILQGYETEMLPSGGTRLILRARNLMTIVDAYAIDAVDGNPPRIVFDIAKQ
ncbi:MAG TPA: hypothetical protein EYG18_01840 [Micavibrio sp.]|nr:hypothetical protein [Micavibrio sp.]HIL27989.1 hypothetical protein [Micavibrio sp.]